MRGLYILLMFGQKTDFKNFLITLPFEIFKSRDVKLALEVVNCIRHSDFGKFFKLLRVRCGFLYSCIMYKVCRSDRSLFSKQEYALTPLPLIFLRIPLSACVANEEERFENHVQSLWQSSE